MTLLLQLLISSLGIALIISISASAEDCINGRYPQGFAYCPDFSPINEGWLKYAQTPLLWVSSLSISLTRQAP